MPSVKPSNMASSITKIGDTINIADTDFRPHSSKHFQGQII